MAVDYISALNAGSGLNTTQIIDSLIDAERAPREAAIQEKIDDADVAISSLGVLKTELNTFNTNVGALSGQNGITLASSSSNIAVTKTGTQPLTEFSHSIEVATLAESQVLQFSGFSTATDAVSLGTLTFTVGSWNSNVSSFTANTDYAAYSLDVSSATTIADVVTLINNSTDTTLADVQASILQTDDGAFSVVIKSHTGAERELQIVDSAGSTFELSSVSDANHQVSAGVDASLTIDGISVTRETNTITDLIDDMSIVISAVTTSEQTISAVYDSTSALSTMTAIVDELNFVLGFLETNTSIGLDGEESGSLYGDTFANNLKNYVRDFTSTAISGYGSDDIYLSYFGVLTNRDGTLSLDSDKFATYFAAYPDNFSALTQSRASSDSSTVTPTIVGDYFEPGTFSLGISSGVATITDSDGVATQLTDATTVYVAPSGNAAGLNIETTLTDGTAEIYMGMSLIDTMTNYFGDILASSGGLANKISLLGTSKIDYSDDLAELDSRMENQRAIYQSQFGAMEGSVASLKKTGDYMTNFMDSWRAGL
ncbi:flagellar filament capping protein FliD [Alphaproteobacteria bacterium]|nr:flagellar filament capping protein FliD [Alphaproteobacteria bacterium]